MIGPSIEAAMVTSPETLWPSPCTNWMLSPFAGRCVARMRPPTPAIGRE
ncbi:MAG: hypothetical protein ACRD5D_04015 [Candidatus Polarisedimenticolia bacterium]